MLRILILSVATACLAACATPTAGIAPADKSAVELERAEQKRLLLAQYRADAQRLYDLVGPLFEAARDICAADKVGPTFGLFDIDTVDLIPRDYRTAARDELGVTDGLVITFMQRGSPLADSGVEVGDAIVAFSGKALAAGRRGYRDFFAQYAALKSAAPVALTVLRQGQQRDVTVNPRVLPRLALHYNPFAT